MKWHEVVFSSDQEEVVINDVEQSRRYAVWEMFTQECTFLIDQLMVLKHVSMTRGLMLYGYRLRT